MPNPTWNEKWLNQIRLGETGLIIGLWAGGIAASDLLVAAILFGAAAFVGFVAVTLDPGRSHVLRILFFAALITALCGSYLFVDWRHNGGHVFTAEKVTVDPNKTEVANHPPTIDQVRPRAARVRIIRIPAPDPAATPRPLPPISSEASAKDKAANDEYRAKIDRMVNQSRAYQSCWRGEMAVSSGLSSLMIDAITAQNAFADSGDDDAVVIAYDKWLSRATDFLVTNRASFDDIGAFVKAKNNFRSPLPGFHKSGNQAWERFDSHRRALGDLQSKIVKKDCNAIADAAAAASSK